MWVRVVVVGDFHLRDHDRCSFRLKCHIIAFWSLFSGKQHFTTFTLLIIAAYSSILRQTIVSQLKTFRKVISSFWSIIGWLKDIWLLLQCSNSLIGQILYSVHFRWHFIFSLICCLNYTDIFSDMPRI